MEETEFQKLINQIRGMNAGQQFNQGVQNNSALMGSASVNPTTGATVPVEQSAAPQKSDKTTNTMNTLGQAGMASGNPYLMAAGLALQVVGGIRSSKAEKERQREQERQNYMQNVIGRLRV